MFLLQVNGQMCEPDPIYADSMGGPYPMPYDSTTMMGGIPDTACMGVYFEFSITIVIPSTFNFGGFPIPVDGFAIESISALPDGISYICNPADCNFTPDDSLACVLLYGTATETGTFDLIINGEVSAAGNNIPVPFPGPIAEGNYFLTVKDANQGECIEVGTENLLANHLEIKNSPNPFAYETNIEINATESSQVTFHVYDLVGKMLHNETVQLLEGKNVIPFDGSELSNGIYIYNFSNESGRISEKMIINR